MAFEFEDIPFFSAIVGSSGGSGIKIKNIEMTDSNNFKIIEDNETQTLHSLSLTYDGSKIIGIKYDGSSINIEYDNNGDIIKIGETDIKLKEPILSPVCEIRSSVHSEGSTVSVININTTSQEVIS